MQSGFQRNHIQRQAEFPSITGIYARYCMGRGIRDTDRSGHYFYVQLSDDKIGKLLRDSEANSVRWRPETSAAMRIAPHVLLRPNELCDARWAKIDLDATEWRLAPERALAFEPPRSCLGDELGII